MQIRTNSLCEGDPNQKIDIDLTDYKMKNLLNLDGQVGYMVGIFGLEGPKKIKEFKKLYPNLFFNNKMVMFKSHFRFLKPYLDFKKLLKHPKKYFKALKTLEII